VTSPQPAPLKPTEMARLNAAGNFHYVLYFQQPGVAEVELERDVRRTLRGLYRDPVPLAPLAQRPAPGVFGPAGGGLLDRLPDGPLGKYMSEAELDVYVKAFEKTAAASIGIATSIATGRSRPT
jgi:hypothetical protein